jgi:hypothetical protein
VRYLCTIYSQNHTFAAKPGFASDDADSDGPVGKVVVSGTSPRQAAARAYVECVGRTRARMMREKQQAPRWLAAQEANPRAIAASLRKTKVTQGHCYLLDNLVEGWLITVESVVPMPPSSPRLRRVRLPHPLLIHFLRTPLSN